MTVAQLTETERAEALAALPAWTLRDDASAIYRSFRFADFSEAFAFMTRVALLAEKHDHHPEWSNVWNRVEITLTTHDAEGLSKRDVDMAWAIDRLLGSMRPLAVLATLLLAAPAAAQEAPEWAGVWQGTVGNASVRMCLDAYPGSPGRGSYYYMAHLEPIALAEEAEEGGWIERGPGVEVQAHWDFAELTATRARGTWRQGSRRVPFSLVPIAWEESRAYDDHPCTSAEFMQPRLGGGQVVDEPGRISGLAYTLHRYVPAAHFADDVAAQNFSFAPQQPGDAAIVRRIATLVPMPGEAVRDDVWQCIASGIADNGTDGSFEQSVEPRMAAGPYLTVEMSSGWYCGGAHPDNDLSHRTYDRTTGEEVNVDDWIGTPDADGAVAVPAELRELVIRRWPSDPDLTECREVAAGTDYWDVELALTGLTFTPSFPHALKGCEVPVTVEWTALAPFLDAEGRAGLARLRAE